MVIKGTHVQKMQTTCGYSDCDMEYIAFLRIKGKFWDWLVYTLISKDIIRLELTSTTVLGGDDNGA